MSRGFCPRCLLWFAATPLFGAAPALAQRALSFAVPGDQIVGPTVARVLFTPQGSEHRVVFNFAFNPSVISYTGLAVGAGVSGATLALDFTQLSSGIVGVEVQLPAGINWGSSARELLTINFTAVTSVPMNSTLAFAGSPKAPGIFDQASNSLFATFTPLPIFVAPPPAIPAIAIQPTSQTAVVGGNATFSVVAHANPSPTYRWQRQPAGTTGFVDLTASSTYLNVATAHLTVSGATLAMSADQFRCVATNANGNTPSDAVPLSVVQAPVITSANTATFFTGAANSFTFTATGTPAPTFNIVGTLPAGVTFNAATGVISGTPKSATGSPFTLTVTATNGVNPKATQGFTLNVSTTPARLASLSMLTSMPTEGVTARFTVQGSGTKSVLIRGVGPTLGAAPFNVSGAMADPWLTLSQATTGTVLLANDNWGGGSDIASVSSAVGAFPLPTASKDAAIVVTLTAGTYSVRLQGVGGTTGIALIEVYEASPISTTRFSYLALQTSFVYGQPATAGFVVGGGAPANLLVRALGPSLGGLTPLVDPMLSFYSGSTLVASNNDWGGSTALSDAAITAGAVPLIASTSKDSALVTTVSPGSHSAVATNGVFANGTTLVEIFDLGAVGPNAPYFLTPPLSQAAVGGASVTLTAAVAGSPAPTLQWRRNSSNLSGATNSTLVLNPVQLTDAATYDVVATNSAGTAVSAAAILSVTPPTPPMLLALSPGTSGSATVGTSPQFSVSISGSAPLTYQWRKGGAPISGATNASLTLPNVQLADAGTYDIVVANAAGNLVSPGIIFTVTPPQPPSIVSQPQSGLVAVGNVVRFAVTANGTGTLSYQWHRNNVALTGATASQYAFVATSPADAAVFHVVVSNSLGTVTSAPATLSFGQLPLQSAPASQFVRLGDPVTLAIAPVGGTTPTYQWHRNSIPLSDATNSTFILPAITAGEIGSYTVTAGNEVVAATTRGPAILALRGTGALGRKLLAVGAGGTLLASDNGLTWSARSIGIISDPRGVAASGSRAIAVGVGGTLLTSSDSVVWTSVGLGNSTALNAVAAGPDRFVVAGDGGRVLVSPDGFGWYLADSRTNQNLNALTYGKGLFVFAGNNGALFTSPDGFNWTNRNSQTTSTITQLVYSGNQFWALTVSSQLLTSLDGVTWTRLLASPPPWLRSLAFDGQKFIAVGDAGRVSTSVDGFTWTPRDSGTLQNLLGVTWTGDELPSAFTPDALLSHLNLRIVAPPLSFSALPGQPARFSVSVSGGGHAYLWSKDGAPIATATQDTLIIPAAGAADVAEYSVTITSAAGTLVSAPARLALIGAGALGSQFLAVGGDGTVLTSADGLSFTARGTHPGRALRAVATSAFRAVAVGQGNLAAVSDHGVTWSYRTLPGASVTLRGVAANATHFVAVGAVGTILTSPDQGETWIPAASVTTNSLWSVAWNGNRFLAVGDGGTVIMSPDGLSWSHRTSPTSERLYAVGANGESFVAATEGGRTFTTSDAGATWQTGAVSGALWVRGAALAPGGRRVIVGDSGQIASSPNGADWVRQTSSTTERLYGVTWSGLAAAFAAGIDVAVTSPGLRIITPPASLVIAAGGTATFSVSAGGVSPLTYQWQRNGIDLPGAVTSVLILGNVQASDAATYTVLVSNGTGIIASGPATLTVTPPGTGTAPVITESPASRSAHVGGATTFTVVATGSAPLVYRWQFNGQTIPGALTATLALSHLQLANSGSYTVTVSNAFGAVVSTPAVLSVTAAAGSPVITQHPVGQAVPVGGVATFLVVATGTGPLSYQWRKDGVVLAGATTDTLRLDPVALSHAGVYTATVTNAAGAAISELAGLTAVPPGTAAVHVQSGGQGYVAGDTVTISNSLSYVGAVQSLGWDVLLPVGWSLVSASGAQGDIRPAGGETQLLSWAWTTPPPSPVNFSYTLQVPEGTSGTYAFAALAVLRQGGVPIQLVARADPLVLAPAGSFHSADTDGDRAISLFELTRVIELYNTRNGTVRTGAYRVDATNLEDGFAADPARPGGSTAVLTRYHSADTRGATTGSPRDGAIDLVELTRVIELYNTRAGTVRTGRYHVQSGTEDGFAAGP